MKGSVTDYTLYAKRYLIGYILLSAAVVGLVAIAALFVPGELRQGEIDSALASGALSIESIDPGTIVNLPYYILQRAIFMAIGVSTLSIKLPSIILGVLTTIGIFVLVRTWFRRNIAVIVTAIAASATQFLFLLQDGTPAIMFPFITVWLLAASTFITRAKYFSTLWKVVTCVLMATALYIPLGIYLVIALIVTASLHPHIRYVIRRVSRSRLIIAAALGVASIVPLIYAVVLKPSVALMLLGIPTTGINIMESVPQVGQDLFGFFATSNSHILRPMYPIGLAILIIIGIYKLLTVKHTARSYTVLILSGFLVPLVLIDPTHATALYPVAVLMIAMGIASLIADWYKLFPRNPYARIAGLVPITVLVGGLMFTGSMRFINHYTYNPNILSHYSGDLRLLETTLPSVESPHKLVVSSKELPFYGLVAHYQDNLVVTTDSQQKDTYLILTRDAKRAQAPNALLTRIITNPRATDSDRFYIYKSPSK